MANGEHRTVTIEEGDTVIISASPVPGNEKAVSRVINRLCKAGAEVLHKGNAAVHVSGHAASEDLKLMLNLTQPEYFVPIHGETRHLAAHARHAEATGVPHEYIFVMDNGDCLEIDDEGAHLGDRVESGVVYVDGLTVGDIGQVILRDRQHMSQDGFVSIVVVIDVADRPAGRRTADRHPRHRARRRRRPHGELTGRVSKTLAKTGREGATDQAVVKRALRESVSQLLWERIRRRPMIVPVVMEV